MITDPLGDMLIRIKNGYLAGKKDVTIPYSNLKMHLAEVLKKEGYLDSVKAQEKEDRKTIHVTLVYENQQPKLTNVVRISKPGVRMYTKKSMIPVVLGGLGTVILSTPAGLMSGKDARKKGLGGEIICKVW